MSARANDDDFSEMAAENMRLRAALKPFAKGADEIPDNWPDGRALLIDQKHPDNPKPYCLLLARVGDFRRARVALTRAASPTQVER